jgi:hypothetical protein
MSTFFTMLIGAMTLAEAAAVAVAWAEAESWLREMQSPTIVTLRKLICFIVSKFNLLMIYKAIKNKSYQPAFLITNR